MDVPAIMDSKPFDSILEQMYLFVYYCFSDQVFQESADNLVFLAYLALK